MKVLYGISIVFAVYCLVSGQDRIAGANPIKIKKMENPQVLKGRIVIINSTANTNSIKYSTDSTIIVKSQQAEDTITVNANTAIARGIRDSVKRAGLHAKDGGVVLYKRVEGHKATVEIVNNNNALTPAVPVIPADGAKRK